MATLEQAAECRRSGDLPGALAAVDALLAAEPRNLHALMFKGELMDALGEFASAAAFYQAVVTAAGPQAQWPAETRSLIAEAGQRAESRTRQLGQALESQLADLAARSGSRRFRHSLDILLGRREVYVQQPRQYYFPELPQIQFFDRELFPWLDRLEAATERIRDELLGVLADQQAFEPYVRRHSVRPHLNVGGLLESSDWTACYLLKNGERIDANADRCPQTMKLLESLPLPRLPGCSPSALFSQLRPGARIPPHTGIINTRLICHLPLVVPPGCAFRVGNETREWVEGQAWLFDDTIEHEAWNRSNRTRVILLFEVWRPELTETERELVAAMFAAIQRTRGPGADWGIQ